MTLRGQITCLLPFLIEEVAGLAQKYAVEGFPTEAQVRYQASLCGVYGGQGVTVLGFSPNTLLFLCQYISGNALFSF
jgi:hypothetical protein